MREYSACHKIVRSPTHSQREMEGFGLSKVLVAVLLVLKTSAKQPEDHEGDKKHLVVYHNKPHQSGKCDRCFITERKSCVSNPVKEGLFPRCSFYVTFGK